MGSFDRFKHPVTGLIYQGKFGPCNFTDYEVGERLGEKLPDGREHNACFVTLLEGLGLWKPWKEEQVVPEMTYDDGMAERAVYDDAAHHYGTVIVREGIITAIRSEQESRSEGLPIVYDNYIITSFFEVAHMGSRPWMAHMPRPRGWEPGEGQAFWDRLAEAHDKLRGGGT